MNTNIPRHRALRLLGAALLAGWTFPTLSGCDTNARFNVNQIQFKDMRVLGVWPARDNNGTLERSCGGGAIDGFMFNLAFTSTQRTDRDPDNSIRPGDVVAKVTVDGTRANDIKLSGTNNLSLAVDCLDPLPDPNGATTCDTDSGGVQPSLSQDPLVYRDLAQRVDDRNILFVVDLSGSTAGFVDVDDSLEYPNDGSGNAPGQLTTLASDFGGFRFAQMKTFIEGLRDNDFLGILAFREGLEGGGIAAPCVDFGWDGQDKLDGLSWTDKLNACYGRNRDGWLAGIDALSGEKNWGRANLWETVGEAYDFLAAAPKAAASHIIVISDGPDTCGYDGAATDCKFSCSEVGVDDVLKKITAGQAANPRTDIQVHFVQFDSFGYRGPDAQQMEVACTSGGHYQFINRTALPNENPAKFQGALGIAIENVRLALMGNWQLGVQMSALSSGQTALGKVFSLSGTVTLETSSQMVTEQKVAFFAGGENGVADARPKLRKACSSSADCGFTGAEDECTEYCSAGSRLCDGGSVGLPKKNGTPCSTNVCCTNSGGATSCLAPGESCDTCP